MCSVYIHVYTCIIYPEEVCTAWFKQLNRWHVTEADRMLRFGLEMRTDNVSICVTVWLQADSVVDVGTAAYAQLQKIKGRSLDGVENSGNRRTVSFFSRECEVKAMYDLFCVFHTAQVVFITLFIDNDYYCIV